MYFVRTCSLTAKTFLPSAQTKVFCHKVMSWLVAPNAMRGVGHGFLLAACACFIGFTAVAMYVADAIHAQNDATLPLLPETVAAGFLLEHLFSLAYPTTDGSLLCIRRDSYEFVLSLCVGMTLHRFFFTCEG